MPRSAGPGVAAAWSDLPVLILTRPGADSAESVKPSRTLGNVTLLERPVRLATLVTAVRTALRARERQYQIREHLAERAAPRKRCGWPINARTSFSPRSVTNCATRWRRC